MLLTLNLRPKRLRDISAFALTGAIAFTSLISLSSIVGHRIENETVKQNTHTSYFDKPDNEFHTVSIDTKKTPYIEDYFVSYCDENYLNSYLFDGVVVIGDRLSNRIFPSDRVIEHYCV